MNDFIERVDFTELLGEWNPAKKAIMDLALPEKWKMDYGGEDFTFRYYMPRTTIYICTENDIIDIDTIYPDFKHKCVTHKLSTFDVVKFKKEVKEELNLEL